MVHNFLNHLVCDQQTGLEARVTSVIIIESRSTAQHNPHGGALSGVVHTMEIVVKVESERMRTVCGVFTERSKLLDGKIPKDDRLC